MDEMLQNAEDFYQVGGSVFGKQHASERVGFQVLSAQGVDVRHLVTTAILRLLIWLALLLSVLRIDLAMLIWALLQCILLVLGWVEKPGVCECDCCSMC